MAKKNFRFYQLRAEGKTKNGYPNEFYSKMIFPTKKLAKKYTDYFISVVTTPNEDNAYLDKNSVKISVGILMICQDDSKYGSGE